MLHIKPGCLERQCLWKREAEASQLCAFICHVFLSALQPDIAHAPPRCRASALPPQAGEAQGSVRGAGLLLGTSAPASPKQGEVIPDPPRAGEQSRAFLPPKARNHRAVSRRKRRKLHYLPAMQRLPYGTRGEGCGTQVTCST